MNFQGGEVAWLQQSRLTSLNFYGVLGTRIYPTGTMSRMNEF